MLEILENIRERVLDISTKVQFFWLKIEYAVDKNGGEIRGIVVQSVTATSVVSLGYGQDRGVTAIPIMMTRTVVMAILIVMLIMRVRVFATEKGYNLTSSFRAAFMNPHADI